MAIDGYIGGFAHDRCFTDCSEVEQIWRNGEKIFESTDLVPELTTIINYADANGFVKPIDLTPLNDFIKTLKSNGIWEKLDVLYLFAGVSSIDFKCINIINPNIHKSSIHGGITDGTKGLKGNGTDGYIDTNFNPFYDGINYKLNTASRIIYISTQPAVGMPLDGNNIINSNRSYVVASFASYNINTTINNTSGATADTRGVGLKAFVKISATTSNYYNNGTANAQTTPNSSSLPNANQRILYRRESTTVESYSNGEVSFYAMGSVLTTTELNIIKLAIETYISNY